MAEDGTPRSRPGKGRSGAMPLLAPASVLAVLAIMLLAAAAADLINVHSALVGIAAATVVAAVAGWRRAGEAGAHEAAVAADARPALSLFDNTTASVVAALPDPAVMLDRGGRVTAFNGKAQAIAPALRRGEHVSIALRMPELLTALRRVGETGQAERVEFVERFPVDRWSEAFVLPVPTTDGDDSGAGRVLVTLHDLTPLRRAEEMRADFVANASHELRTPLAALSGFIDTLRGPARDDAAARVRFLDIMQAQANRMARLIDDLLSLSRIEMSEHMRPDTPVDLVGIVRQVVDGLQTLATDRQVTMTVTAPTEPLIVAGDRDELIRVFENLVENALKYGAAGGRVDIVCRRGQTADGRPEASVAVRDYGPGIAAEHLPRLTERFYRVDVAESRAQGGTGLGLALVKHSVNRHGGRLAIDSRPGEGATFTVRLPASTGAAVAGGE